MSHFGCPLCGKSSALKNFDPDNLDLDLKIHTMRGLGKGRGFEKTDEHSVLVDDELSPVIARRVIQLVKMFVDAGVVSSEEVAEGVGLGKPLGEIQRRMIELLLQNRAYEEKIRSLEGNLWKIKSELVSKLEGEEYRRRIDILLSGGLGFDEGHFVEFDEEGCLVCLSRKTPGYVLYLSRLVGRLTYELRTSLMKRVMAEDDYAEKSLKIIRIIPRVPTLQERMLGIGEIERHIVDGRVKELHSIPLKIEMSTETIRIVVENTREEVRRVTEQVRARLGKPEE